MWGNNSWSVNVGCFVGDFDGVWVGWILWDVGLFDGDLVGLTDSVKDGIFVGCKVGFLVKLVGDIDGVMDGEMVE